MKKVTVEIGPDGEATVKVSGIKGKGCLSETAELERVLFGRVPAKRSLTKEVYAQADNRIRLRQ